MYKSLHIPCVLFFQFHQIFILFALKLELFEPVEKSESSANWPLQAGYPGLAIKNLNEYVSLFSNCLVNIQNYQGIEIIGIKSPIYITRFEMAYLPYCYHFSPKKFHHRVFRWDQNLEAFAFYKARLYIPHYKLDPPFVCRENIFWKGFSNCQFQAILLWKNSTQVRAELHEWLQRIYKIHRQIIQCTMVLQSSVWYILPRTQRHSKYRIYFSQLYISKRVEFIWYCS